MTRNHNKTSKLRKYWNKQKIQITQWEKLKCSNHNKCKTIRIYFWKIDFLFHLTSSHLQGFSINNETSQIIEMSSFLCPEELGSCTVGPSVTLATLTDLLHLTRMSCSHSPWCFGEYCCYKLNFLFCNSFYMNDHTFQYID